jgi:ABC-2 type transport system ATP-binding protein
MGGDSRNSAAVSVRDVVKSFPTTLSAAAWIRYRGALPRRTVLHEISFDVRPGELFGLLGPNGAGKTTLLKMLATLCIADRGQILISGMDATKRAMTVKSKIGLCTSEERSFYFRLTARENLRLFGALVGLFGDTLESRIEKVVSLVDLVFALDRRYDTFSSGMRQRLSFARALLSDPDIIFFDEPTRAVDPLHARELRALIRDELVTRHNKTVVLATNSLEEAWAICDTVAILQHGRIVAKGSPRTLDIEFTRFIRYSITLDSASDSLIGTLASIRGVHRVTSLKTLDGVALNVELDPDGDSVNELLHALSAGDVTVLSFRSENPQPLDVFVGLTEDRNAS